MVVRSPPSLRRSGRRDDLASSTTFIGGAPDPLSSPASISNRAKRNRVSSVSEAENFRKKTKLGHHEKSVQYKFPLRSRPNTEPLPLKRGTKPLSSDQRSHTPSSVTKHRLLSTSVNKPDVERNGHVSSIDKRALRSQDGGSRAKSELSLYFTDYDQMLSLEPTKPDILAAKTHITLIDDLSQPSDSISASKDSKSHVFLQNSDSFGARKPLHNARRVDLALINPGYESHRLLNDPLPEDVFDRAHRKAERHEKQLRNIERERAQHEKVQLERLLGELKGPDWLRVMGISGITESEKKLYEPKRAVFAKEVAGLIEKFRHWKEEEKRRKIEREQALLTDNDDEDEDEGEEDEGEADDQRESEEEERQSVDKSVNGVGSKDLEQHLSPSPASSPRTTRSGAPDNSDVDAAAARQLHQEAISASSSTTITTTNSTITPAKRSLEAHLQPRTKKKPATTPTTTPTNNKTYRHHRVSPSTTTTTTTTPSSSSTFSPFLPLHQHSTVSSPSHLNPDSGSFFAKAHLREAAIAGHRRGRHKMAFGQPVPDPGGGGGGGGVLDFELPPHILTPEMIRKRARERRRVRRSTVAEAAEATED